MDGNKGRRKGMDSNKDKKSIHKEKIRNIIKAIMKTRKAIHKMRIQEATTMLSNNILMGRNS